MNIKLITNDSSHLSLNDFQFRETEGDCDLEVRVRRFSVSNKFYFDLFYLKKFISQLIEMDKTLKGEAILREEYGDEYISLKCSKEGHLIVSGYMIERAQYPPQEFKFNFETDQTVLKPFISDLKKAAPIGA